MTDTAEAIDFSRYEGHTRADWVIIEDGAGFINVHAPYEDGCLGDIIATVHSVNEEADSRLIADAPKLLSEVRTLSERVAMLEAEVARKDAALREAEDFISNDHENLTNGDLNSNEARAVMRKIRAALSPAPSEGK